jgi:hypothetical protein
MDSSIIQDLLPPNFNDLSVLSRDLLAAYGQLKNKFPDCWINNKDGKRVNTWCGYRTQECTIGAKGSAHKKGMAIDIHAANLDEVRQWILDGNPLKITRIEAAESTPTWIHIDFMPLTNDQKSRVCKNGIYCFKP